jgi:transcriptional regulator with XRE-family HTH domain
MTVERIILRIKHLRLQKDLTQQMVADWLKMKQNAYARIESGATKLTVERLFQIAAVLSSTTNELLSDEPIKLEI